MKRVYRIPYSDHLSLKQKQKKYFKRQIGYTYVSYVVFYIIQAVLWQIESDTRLFYAFGDPQGGAFGKKCPQEVSILIWQWKQLIN